MLRVQSKRRPDDWEQRQTGLSGRFLPMDPRDEAVFEILENKSTHSIDSNYGPEGPPSEAYGSPMAGQPRKWSKRSEVARKRWADPQYRANMLQKRAEKRRRDAAAGGDDELPPKVPAEPRLEIGVMDSIALSDEPRAKAINAYARSIKLRSEKITAFHRNRKLWMEDRLKDSPQHLSDEDIIQQKLDKRERRRQAALKRVRNIRAKKDSSQQNESDDQSEQ